MHIFPFVRCVRATLVQVVVKTDCLENNVLLPLEEQKKMVSITFINHFIDSTGHPNDAFCFGITR